MLYGKYKESSKNNAHARGVFIGVKEDSSLMESAFTEYGEKYKEHPVTHIRFDGYKIHGMDRVVKMAIECHKHTPHLKMISWDFSIDALERVVLNRIKPIWTIGLVTADCTWSVYFWEKYA